MKSQHWEVISSHISVHHGNPTTFHPLPLDHKIWGFNPLYHQK